MKSLFLLLNILFKGVKVGIQKSVDLAAEGRDNLAKALYSQLYSQLFSQFSHAVPLHVTLIDTVS